MPSANGNLQSELLNLKSDILLVGLPQRHLEPEALARLRLWARLGERCRVVCTQAHGDELARAIVQTRVVIVRRRQPDRAWVEERARQAGLMVLVEEETSPERLPIADLRLPIGQYDSESPIDRLALDESGEAGCGEGLEVFEKELADCGVSVPPENVPPAKVPLGKRDLLGRCRHLLAAGLGGDPNLVGDLTRQLAREPDVAELYVALGLATLAHARRCGDVRVAAFDSALEEFRRALMVDPGNIMAQLNLVEILNAKHKTAKKSAECGVRSKEASEAARQALMQLDKTRDEEFLREDAGHFFVGQAFQPDTSSSVRLESQPFEGHIQWHYLRDRFCKVDSSAIRRRSFGANITRCKLEG